MISILGDLDYNVVFCDWLDVTYSPDENVIPELSQFLLSHDFVLDKKSSSDDKLIYRPLMVKEFGAIKIDITFRFVRISTSGAVLSFLRYHNLIPSYLYLLGQLPHRVTRLDLSLDIDKDFPPILQGLRRHYSDGMVSFSRKKQTSRTYLVTRDDGQESGTYYIGTTKSKISSRIYDKQLEYFEKRHYHIPTCTRYELVFKGGVTLKDAANGVPLFWKHSSVVLLNYMKPKNVPTWIDGSKYSGWTSEIEPNPPYVRLERILEDDSLLEAMELISSLLPNGRRILDGMISKKLDAMTSKRLAKSLLKSKLTLLDDCDGDITASKKADVSLDHLRQIASWQLRKLTNIIASVQLESGNS